MIIRLPDKIKLVESGKTFYADGKNAVDFGDTSVELCIENGELKTFVTSSGLVKYLILRWNFSDGERRNEPVKIYSDEWERGYGHICWRGIEPERVMPWYISVSNGSDSVRDFSGRFTECFGVKVQPNAMCSWQYDSEGVTLNMDLRNGGLPVELGGRRLQAAEILFSEYKETSAFDALCAFCKEMCPEPLVYDKIIYGSNNWYYAYGKSSYDEIIEDSKIISSICENNENRPFMVIDDGWQPNSTNPPWEPSEKFGDMKKLAAEMASLGVIPGIWVRYLSDEKKVLNLPDEAYRGSDGLYLDPTHPAVKEHIITTTRNIVNWGYKLIKHDYSSYDINGRWGPSMDEKVTPDGEGFFDRSKTTAEVILDFNRLILANAGDAAILGCNCVSHLCAGLVHANRVGDDTSGREWRNTRKKGVNSLAFRLSQNKAFYISDADCVGIKGDFPWELNRRWLALAAESGTSLFISCKPSEAKGQTLEDLKKAFVPASVQQDVMIPLDWMEKSFPCEYLINNEKRRFNWYTEYGAETLG